MSKRPGQRGYNGPKRIRRKKDTATAGHYPERPAPTLTAQEREQGEKMLKEIEATRRAWDAMDRLHNRRDR